MICRTPLATHGLEHVARARDVHLVLELAIRLGAGRDDRGQVHQRVDAMRCQRLREALLAHVMLQVFDARQSRLGAQRRARRSP